MRLGETERWFDNFGNRCRNELVEREMVLKSSVPSDDHNELRKKIVVIMTIMALIMIPAVIFRIVVSMIYIDAAWNFRV